MTPDKEMVSDVHRGADEHRGMRRERMYGESGELVEIWVPDPGSPEFAEDVRRQSQLVANSPQEKEDMAFIESLANELLAELDRENGGW
jgi:hypothetical protein